MMRAFLLAALVSPLLIAQGKTDRPFRFLVNGTWTQGGDSLVELKYTDGSSDKVKAGNYGLWKIGFDYQPTRSFSCQLSTGWHRDHSKEVSNGQVKFLRKPVEGMAFWHPKNPFLRFGLGLRKANGAKLQSTGFAATLVGNWEFDASLGVVLEAEARTLPMAGGRLGASLRYVSETYTPTRVNGFKVVGGENLKGDHFGIGLSWYI